MPIRKCYIYLGLRGHQLNVDDVTRVLGLQPSSVARAGEPLGRDPDTKEVRTWRTDNIWAVTSSEHVATPSPEEHVRFVLPLLSTQKLAAIEGLEALTLGVDVISDQDEDGLTIPHELILALAAVPCRVEFDLTFAAWPGYDPGQAPA